MVLRVVDLHDLPRNWLQNHMGRLQAKIENISAFGESSGHTGIKRKKFTLSEGPLLTDGLKLPIAVRLFNPHPRHEDDEESPKQICAQVRRHRRCSLASGINGAEVDLCSKTRHAALKSTNAVITIPGQEV